MRECRNYRGISLLCFPERVYAKCFKNRRREIFEAKLEEDIKCCFRPGRSIADRIFTLQKIFEKSCEYRCLRMFYRHWENVRPGSSAKALGVLREYDVNCRLLLAVKLCSSEVCVRVRGVKSEPFTVGIGLQQGYVLSPLLLIFCMNWTDSHSRVNEGATVGSCRIKQLLFVDDLLASSEQGPQRTLDRFSAACESLQKAKSVYVASERNTLQYVEMNKYVGVPFTSDGRWNKVIDTRIGKANAVLRELNRSFVTNKLSNTATLSIFKSVFVPIIICGHQPWVMTETVQGAEMGFLRGVHGATLRDKVRSCDIREAENVEPLLRIERSQHHRNSIVNRLWY